MGLTYDCRDCGEQQYVGCIGHDTCPECVAKLRSRLAAAEDLARKAKELDAEGLDLEESVDMQRELEFQHRAAVMLSDQLDQLRASLPPRRFPIMDGPSIPWAMIAMHERQARLNHSQSLEELAGRGGLSPREALWVLDDERIRLDSRKDLKANHDELERRRVEYEAAHDFAAVRRNILTKFAEEYNRVATLGPSRPPIKMFASYYLSELEKKGVTDVQVPKKTAAVPVE